MFRNIAFLWHIVGPSASMDDTLSFPNTLGLLVLLRFCNKQSGEVYFRHKNVMVVDMNSLLVKFRHKVSAITKCHLRKMYAISKRNLERAIEV